MSALYTAVFTAISVLLDRYRRSVKVRLNLTRAAETIAAALNNSFLDLANCGGIWSVRSEGRTSDWKRNAGAAILTQRDKIRPRITRPKCIRGHVAFPMLKLSNAELFFLPDAVLIVSNQSAATLNYKDVDFSTHSVRYIEADRMPSDATVVDETWLYVNKNGGPDRRFNSNRRLPVCNYGEMDFSSAGGLNGRLQFSKLSAGDRFAKALEILIKHSSSGSQLNPIASYQIAKRWPSAIFLACALLFGGPLLAAGLEAISVQSQITSEVAAPITDTSDKQIPLRQKRVVTSPPQSGPLNILPSGFPPSSSPSHGSK